MKKITKQVIEKVQLDRVVNKDFYITDDGETFENEDEAKGYETDRQLMARYSGLFRFNLEAYGTFIYVANTLDLAAVHKLFYVVATDYPITDQWVPRWMLVRKVESPGIDDYYEIVDAKDYLDDMRILVDMVDGRETKKLKK